MVASGFQPVFALKRGGHLESLHFGAVAVVSAAGKLLYAVGDAQAATFLRSSAKPFQALPLVLAGGIEHYGLTPQDLALMCASHSGTDEHAAAVARLQEKVGISEELLQCGIHPPMHKVTAERMQGAGEPLTPNRHNCSGKHTGMLAACLLRSWRLDTYLEIDHPLQQEIRAGFAQISNCAVDQMAIGIDGCSAPIWAAPLYNTALAYARLTDPAGLSAPLNVACTQLREAMTSNPDLVAGPERFDTALMQATNGRILSKGGAEGFQGLGIPAGALGAGSPALGIALKISDGDTRTWVCHTVTLEVMRQLGALTQQELAGLSAFGPTRPITNWRGIPVGEGVPVFELEKQ